MDAIRFWDVEKLHFPVDGYNCIVEMVTSVDGGETFWHCGNTRYFETEAEATEYAVQMNSEEAAG